MYSKYKHYKNAKVKPKDLSYINRKRSFAPGFIYSIGSIFVLTLFTIVPFVYVILDATNENPLIASDERIVGPGNFNNLFRNDAFAQSIQNSFLYMLITVPGSIILATLISWGISSLHRKYARGFWQSLFFIPYVTSTVAISLSFAYIFDAGHGLLNLIIEGTGGKRQLWLVDSSGVPELGAISLFGLWRNMAFDVLLLSTAMMGVDRKLYKVSELDGAKPMRQFWSITVPQVLPVYFYLLTLSIIQSIKVFPLALFNNNPAAAVSVKAQSLLLYVYYLIRIGQYGTAGAASIMMALISIGVVIVFRTLPNSIRRAYIVKTSKNIDRTYSFWKLFIRDAWTESVFGMNKAYRNAQ